MIHTTSAWDERVDGHRNAFDAIRLLLATLVVFEHSFFLIDGNAARDPLQMFSGGQMHFGAFAVYMFFSLSGYLVTRSLMLSPNIIWFMARRVARIAPGFVVATAFGCLVVGLLTTPSVRGYLSDQNWFRVLVTTLALKQAGVAGALPNNPLSLVHGTLWSIKFEFDCYLLLALMGVLGLLRQKVAAYTFAALATFFVFGLRYPHLLPDVDHGAIAMLISSPKRWPELFSFFFFGSAFYVFRDAIRKSAVLAIASGLAVVGAFLFGGAWWALMIFGTYAVLYVALSFAVVPRIAGKRVDLSYGVYLYGWPIQQLTIHYWGPGLDPGTLFFVSLAVTFVVAFLSWRIVEAPALRFVRNLEKRRSHALSGQVA